MNNFENPRSETAPEQPKKRSGLGKIKDAAALSLAALAGACGLSPEAVAQMPTTEVSEIVAHPEKFKSLRNIKLVGYLHFSNTETYRDSLIEPTYKNKKFGIKTVYRQVREDSYEIYGMTTMKDQPFHVRMKACTEYTDSLAISLIMSPPDIARCEDGKAYRLVGTMESKNNDSGKKEYYIELNPKDQERVQRITEGAESDPKSLATDSTPEKR